MDKAYHQRIMTSLINKLRQKMVEVQTPITGWTCRHSEYPSPGSIEYVSEWTEITPGDSWLGSTVFFKALVSLGKEFEGRNTWLCFENDGESLLYLNGEPVQGFDPNRNLYKICDAGKTGTPYEILVESCLRWQNKAHYAQSGVDYHPHLFKKAALISVNMELYELALDIECLNEHFLTFGSEASGDLIEFMRLHLNPDAAHSVLMEQAPRVREKVNGELHKFKQMKGSTLITAVGHSHLDLGYLWPVKETVRKCARTFSNMLALMYRYPDFHFTQSQPILYQFCKTYYPSLFDRVKQYVKEGRWEVNGGMLVEPDCNLISGESLVRQLLYGLQLVEKEFGVKMDTCWLPDTFGFTASLPQILKKCGIKYFYTLKIRRNRVNEFPHNLFYWEGIDGSKILSVVDAFDTYAGNMQLSEIDKGCKGYKNKKIYKNTMYLYGHGDGGGGVTSQMVERLHRYDCLPNIPAIKCGTASTFFSNAEKNAVNLPTWQGELYFEWHQGTYTSQALLKKLNRISETTYRTTELLSVLSGNAVPEDLAEILQGWEAILFNQFHDILPGSCTGEVAAQAAQEYRNAISSGVRLTGKYLSHLFGSGQEEPMLSEHSSLFAVFNPLSFERTDFIELGPYTPAIASIEDVSSGRPAEYFRLSGGNYILQAQSVPSLGYKLYRINFCNGPDKEAAVPGTMAYKQDGFVILENDLVKVVTRKADGIITSIYDKEVDRETLAGRGNYFELFPECYDFYDAWNISAESLENGEVLTSVEKLEIVENCPILATLSITRKFSNSWITQQITLRKESKRIDFSTLVDWNETGKLLKVGFDTSIHSIKAVYDIAYGNLERSTRENTTWEKAQHEVSAHKWADLSEYGYGTALLNDCKYGYDIRNSTMRLTLLKSPKYPDNRCDIGTHSFTYSFFPHTGDWRQGKVDCEGYALNVPLMVQRAGVNTPGIPPMASFLSVNQPGVFIEAVKYSEDGIGDIIVRAYENHGASIRCEINVAGLGSSSVFECDLLEKEETECPLVDGILLTTFKPYEIKTFRLKK